MFSFDAVWKMYREQADRVLNACENVENCGIEECETQFMLLTGMYRMVAGVSTDLGGYPVCFLHDVYQECNVALSDATDRYEKAVRARHDEIFRKGCERRRAMKEVV